MSLLSNIRLSTRIYVQQAALVLALVALSLFSLQSARDVSSEVAVIKNSDLPIVADMSQTASRFLRRTLNVERMRIYGPNIGKDPKAQEQFKKYRGRFVMHQEGSLEFLESAMKRTQDFIESERAAGDTEHVALLEKTLSSMQDVARREKAFAVQVLEMADDFEAGRVAEAVDAGDKMTPLIIENNAALEAFNLDVQKLQEYPVNAINTQMNSLVRTLMVITGLVIVMAIVMVVYTGLILGGLRRAMGNIGNSVQQVASAASQSSNAISVVADGAKQQSEAIAQAVTAVSQSAAVLNDVSRSAEESRVLAQEGVDIIKGSLGQMARTVAVINRIVDNSGKINKITDVIDNIASQTNMLSLNAAIEAARAGEQGKGFAVVAEQVRKLAESSRSSVQDIMDLAQQAARDANEAVQAASRMDTELNGIAKAAGGSVNLMIRIATAMEEQVATVEQLQHNMDSLKSIGNNNANAAEEITQTVLEMSHIADDTNTEVRKFNI